MFILLFMWIRFIAIFLLSFMTIILSNNLYCVCARCKITVKEDKKKIPFTEKKGATLNIASQKHFQTGLKKNGYKREKWKKVIGFLFIHFIHLFKFVKMLVFLQWFIHFVKIFNWFSNPLCRHCGW